MMDIDEALDTLDIFTEDDGSYVERQVEWIDSPCECCSEDVITFVPVTLENLRNELKELVGAERRWTRAKALMAVISHLERLRVGESDSVHGSVKDGAL